MIMEVEFRISKYTQVFNTVGTGFGGLKKFTVEDQCISLPRQINRSDFIDVQFHKVCTESMSDLSCQKSERDLMSWKILMF
jgi:hypothetical protein